MTSTRRVGRGILKIRPILRTNSTDRLREMRTRGRGGGGAKIPKILRTSYEHGPYYAVMIHYKLSSQ